MITRIGGEYPRGDTLCDFSLASFMSFYLFVEVFLAFFMALVESTNRKLLPLLSVIALAKSLRSFKTRAR